MIFRCNSYIMKCICDPPFLLRAYSGHFMAVNLLSMQWHTKDATELGRTTGKLLQHASMIAILKVTTYKQLQLFTVGVDRDKVSPHTAIQTHLSLSLTH